MSGNESVTVTFAGSVGVIATLAGNGTAGNAGGGLAVNAELHNPYGVFVDASGNTYIADTANNRILEVSVTTGEISTVAGNGTAGYNGDWISPASAELNSPSGVFVDTFGNIYIADTNNNRIREVIAALDEIVTLAGDGIKGFSGDGGSAASAELNVPMGVVLDNTLNVYIADTNNNRIRKVAGGVISTIAGDGTAGYNGNGILSTSAELNTPSAVAVDASGNIYIADSGNARIREVTAGNITTVAGTGTSGYNGDGILATNAEISEVTGVASDPVGNIYIADTNNCRIRKVAVSTGIITTVAGDGTCGYSGDSGVPDNAELSQPQSVAVDTEDNIYIADTSNERIRNVSQ